MDKKKIDKFMAKLCKPLLKSKCSFILAVVDPNGHGAVQINGKQLEIRALADELINRFESLEDVKKPSFDEFLEGMFGKELADRMRALEKEKKPEAKA